ncbi:MAG: HAD family hydrolase [Marmoricola sp.]
MSTAVAARAVLFDFDGTLVDTEPYWIEEEFALVESFGGTWSREHALRLVGNDLLESGRYIIEHTGVPLTPVEVVDRLLDGVVRHMAAAVPWRPGARELLAALRADGVPCGLVTMSYRRFVEPALDALPAGTFDCVVTGETVARGKPDPEPYARGAELLGLEPADCVAVEDSTPGVTSALAAGCRVLVVPNHVEVADRPGLHRAASLADLDPAGLRSLG